jgi:hypothetical protein
MSQTIKTTLLTIFVLILLDLTVAFGLNWAESHNKFDSLVRYFEYGRSVPGKIKKWHEVKNVKGNLLDVAWLPNLVEESSVAFADEHYSKPVIRTYGFSFVNHIMKQLVSINDQYPWDAHAGPGAPPNFTFSAFENDRENRKSGDIVILGVLSSSLTGMAALSNQTWAFEQPAPFTYPIYTIEESKLAKTEPVVYDLQDQLRVFNDDQAKSEWYQQLAEHDKFFSPITYGMVWLDNSPFVRLVRRTLAKSHIQSIKSNILESQEYDYKNILGAMFKSFAEKARKDGQLPIVMLIQSNKPDDPNLLALYKQVLEQEKITYFSTENYFSPKDTSGFLPDGHYKQHVDTLFAEELLKLLDKTQTQLSK